MICSIAPLALQAVHATLTPPNVWIGRAIVIVPLLSVVLAWLSLRRVRDRNIRREAERAAVFAGIARAAARRYGSPGATPERRQPLRPSDPPV